MHFGSLCTALASFLQARSKQGKWLLRIDDLDTPRNVAGATEQILRTLEIFGLNWDDCILYQSLNSDSYQAALDDLEQQNLLYPCICSRRTLSQYRHNNPAAPAYPGLCRNRQITPDTPYSLRIKTEDKEISFQDGLQNQIHQNLALEHGDFILKRKDRIIAYQLSVVVDEHAQGITEVVRGVDLIDSTPKQIFLQQQLGYKTPKYMHVPVIIDQLGYKLSKQTFAQAIDENFPEQTLYKTLSLLKQNPPVDLQTAPIATQLNWAIEHWNPESLKKIRAIDLGIY